ncbi:hypothetical protein QBC45DRAFT_329541 [Copromyces sp. CBS 386.78]|nr:hypothetical protein QBC45DRAFT_329541 [Copromyces sp. CBS 386.78]
MLVSRHPVLRAEMEQGHKRNPKRGGLSASISTTICAIQQAFSASTPFPFVDLAVPPGEGRPIACRPDLFHPMPETPVR